jgi:hypothetical protein
MEKNDDAEKARINAEKARIGKMYVEQTKLLKYANDGDITSMHIVMGYVIDGNFVVPGAALDVILSIERHLPSTGFDLNYASVVLERVLTSPSTERVSPAGDQEVTRQIWNPALRQIDASYALKVLAKPEFEKFGYNLKSLLDIASRFGDTVKGSGYGISGSMDVTRVELVEDPELKKEVPTNVVYNIDFGNKVIKKLDDIAA